MTVGEYAGVPLQDAADTWRHGAVFLLRKAPRGDEQISVSVDGWTITVVGGVRAVITCGPLKNVRRYEATFDHALQMANKGLDLMCVQGLADGAISEASTDCMVWWPDRKARGVVIRTKVVPRLPMPHLQFTVTVADAQGNVVPPQPTPTQMIHDVYRFIRMSRTSDDLYDSYRNLFLAFECLLSDIRPPRPVPPRTCFGITLPGAKSKRESETAWFKAALSEADKLVSVADLTDPGVTNHQKWVYRHMYEGERCALMHAKQGGQGPYLLPQEGVNRHQLVTSLGRLSSYLRRLIDAHLDLRYMGNYWADVARRASAEAVLNALRVVVSDDPAPVDPAGGNPISGDSETVELQHETPTEDIDDPGLWTVLAHCGIAELSALNAIRKFGVKSDDDVPGQAVSELSGPLNAGSSVVRLEVLFGNHMVNRSELPSVFSS
jgi:hypothetical protein